MNRIHDQEKEQFKKLFRHEGIRNYRDSLAVLDVFLDTEQHVTSDELTALLHKKGVALDEDFVESTLNLMCRFGFAHKIRFDNGAARYEHRHLMHHHDHMICTKCGTIIEFEDDRLEKLQAEIAERYGFYMLQHKMNIYGLCRQCMGKRVAVMPLLEAKTGERLTIEGFAGGTKAQMRMLSMGLRTGDELEVISSQSRGQLVVAVEGRRYVLGRGLSAKILVRNQSQSPAKSVREPDIAVRRKPDTPLMTLKDLKEGDRAQIVRVGGDRELRRRILEMGIVKGTEIYIAKYAPLRDPLELVVKGTHLSLRVEEACRIVVENVRHAGEA